MAKKTTKGATSTAKNAITERVSLPSNWTDLSSHQQRVYLRDSGVSMAQRDAYQAHSPEWLQKKGYFSTSSWQPGTPTGQSIPVSSASSGGSTGGTPAAVLYNSDIGTRALNDYLSQNSPMTGSAIQEYLDTFNRMGDAEQQRYLNGMLGGNWMDNYTNQGASAPQAGDQTQQPQIQPYQAPAWNDPGGFQSSYSQYIQDLVNKVTNREPFSYDPLQDDVYQAYASEYGRLGRRANEDTMANVATNTGGLASSWAVTAANQAENDYMQQLSDKIPELEQLAYQRWADQRDADLNTLTTFGNLEDSEYNRYSTDRAFNRDVYESDRDYGYNQYRDQVADNQWQTEFDENKRQFNKNYHMDVLNYRLDRKQTAWTIKYQKNQQKFDNAMNKWTTLGYATKGVAKTLGIKEGTKTSDQKYRELQMLQMRAQIANTNASTAKIKGSTSGSSGGSGGTKSKGGSSGKSGRSRGGSSGRSSGRSTGGSSGRSGGRTTTTTKTNKTTTTKPPKKTHTKKGGKGGSTAKGDKNVSGRGNPGNYRIY